MVTSRAFVQAPNDRRGDKAIGEELLIAGGSWQLAGIGGVALVALVVGVASLSLK
jgi:hypothetical protein